MKQKASLCCALIHHPALLLLDEPTFGVDPISRRDLWIILHEMAVGGMTIVLTTSYLDEAERCDRVALLDHGRLLASGTPAQLQQSHAGRLLAVPLGRDRALRGRVAALPGVIRVVPFGDEVHVTLAAGADDDAVRAGIASIAHDAPAARFIEPSLEDVFLARVAEPHG
jgi:ABC-2 type transport system ATP-binding protein